MFPPSKVTIRIQKHIQDMYNEMDNTRIHLNTWVRIHKNIKSNLNEYHNINMIVFSLTKKRNNRWRLCCRKHHRVRVGV